MKTLFNENEYFNEDYYERGAETGKSLYSHYRWMPELTIPMAHHLARYMDLDDNEKVLDVGCGNGNLIEFLSKEKNVDCKGIEIELEKMNCENHLLQAQLVPIFGEHVAPPPFPTATGIA